MILTKDDLLADPERAALLALAVHPKLAGVALSPDRFEERIAELSLWLPPGEALLRVPAAARASDLLHAERLPGWEKEAFLARAAGRIVTLAHPAGLDPAARALLLSSPVRIVAPMDREDVPRGGWPLLSPRSSSPADPVLALRERLSPPEPDPSIAAAVHAARLALPEVRFEEKAWAALAGVARRLAPGALGDGDGRLVSAARALAAWAALLGHPSVGEGLVERLGDIFPLRESAPSTACPERASHPYPPRDALEPPEDAGDVAKAAPPELPAVAPSLGKGRRSPGETGREGRVLYHRRPADRRPRIDVAATLRRALPFQRLRGTPAGARPHIREEDLRVAVRRRRSGAVHLVVLDASGSMGGERVRLGRGAALALLSEAHLSRESVGLIVIGRGEARLAVPPMRAPERVRRAVLSARATGGTPLPRALAIALEAARRAKAPVSVLLVTDGRANLTLAGDRDPERAGVEVSRLLAGLAALGARAVVLARGSDGPAREFAERNGLPLIAVHPLHGFTR
ncbi:MAG: VWA domain-containing protein [Planctomycetes bacterium]|nr:VWA domain-containing protein [Planctomycetota bacterium]